MRISHCIKATARAFNVTMAEMKSQRRAHYVSHPRQAAMLLARWEGFTLARIGREFGDRDHSTVSYACLAAEKRAKVDEEYCDRLQEAWIGLNGHHGGARAR